MVKKHIFFGFQKIVLILTFLVSFGAYADTGVEENYNASYIKHMKPMMYNKLKKVVPDITEEQLKVVADPILLKMAHCQFQGINKYYPKKYRDAAVLPISNGADFLSATESFDALIMTDIESGALPPKQAQKMLENAKTYILKCNKKE